MSSGALCGMETRGREIIRKQKGQMINSQRQTRIEASMREEEYLEDVNGCTEQNLEEGLNKSANKTVPKETGDKGRSTLLKTLALEDAL